MFGSSTPFGQSSTSPFGSQSVFGQTNGGSNPFAPKPFGSPNPFGSQTGSSIFGGTSTGVFGQPSTPAFGASATPAFGSSTSAFGSSSTPAFGSASSSFGGSSLFGQKPAFGSFGSSSSQSSPFGSSPFPQTQSAFGNNLFGSTSPFGASSQPSFGATTSAFASASTSAFGATPTSFGATPAPAFGATSTPAFGSATTPAFGSTSTLPFGPTGSSFGVSSSPAFGSTVTPSFGAPTTSLFGSSTTSAFGASAAPTFGSPTVSTFGASSAPTFGSPSVPAFGASSSPSFSFGSSPSFGQSASAFGSTPFGASSSPFGAQSSPFGSQATTPTFGSTGFGQSAVGAQPGGTRAVPYTPTPDVDGGTGSQPAGKLESISAMPAYKDKSHEELRWEDYQRGDKGGPSPPGQSAGAINFSTPSQPSPFAPTGGFGQSGPNVFPSSTPSNPFAVKSPSFGSSGFGSTSTSIFSSPFTTASSSPFGSTTSTTSLFGASTGSVFGSSSSAPAFGGATAPAFGSSTSLFGSSLAGTSSAFGTSPAFGSTQPSSSGLFQSSSSPSPFGQTTSLFGQPSTGNNSTFGSNIFSTPSTGFGGSLFSSSTPSLFPSSTPAGFSHATPSAQTPFQQAVAQPTSTFSFANLGSTQPASSGGFGVTSNILGQSTFGQLAASPSNMVMQPAPVTNPLGTLPPMPQISIGRVGYAPTIQYGISSLPVADKPIPTRTSPLLVPRYTSQRRMRLPPRRYHPKTDSPRVPFYVDDEIPSTPKADALVIPRENPRALIIRPVEQWPPRSLEKASVSKDGPSPAENGKVPGEPSAPAYKEVHGDANGEPVTENGHAKTTASASKALLKENGTSDDDPRHKANGTSDDDPRHKAVDSYVKISGHRAGKAAIAYEHGAEIEAVMPKLRQDDYYTEPRTQELAAKERAEPGFCRRVKDFVVGRHGFGSVKFYGETDVRGLDLESIVQFNHREVIVYKDDDKKPPIGQGLNKPGEVTLLNIKAENKKTGQKYTGPALEKYKEMLAKKGQEQGAEFISYDPIKEEWKFRVEHF